MAACFTALPLPLWAAYGHQPVGGHDFWGIGVVIEYTGDPRHALEGREEQALRLRAENEDGLQALWSATAEESIRRLDQGLRSGRLGEWTVPVNLRYLFRVLRTLGEPFELNGLHLSWTDAEEPS